MALAAGCYNPRRLAPCDRIIRREGREAHERHLPRFSTGYVERCLSSAAKAGKLMKDISRRTLLRPAGVLASSGAFASPSSPRSLKAIGVQLYTVPDVIANRDPA